MSERRRFIRWQVNRQAKVKLKGVEAFANCHIKDISLKGIQLSLRQKLKEDAFLKLIVALADEFILDIIEAWVIWHKVIDGVNVYGLYFDKMRDLDKEKIYQFIHRNFPDQLIQRWWQGLERGGEQMEDKRIFARINAEFPLKFIDLNENREGMAKAHNVSAKGVGFVVKEELKPRTPLEMWLQIPDRGESLYTRGEVVWSKMVSPNEFRVGVDLERADLMGISRILRSLE